MRGLTVSMGMLAVGAAAAFAGPSAGSAPTAGAVLPTRAEASNYEETSSHADVMDYLQKVVAGAPNLHLTHFGYSASGRRLPLVVAGAVTGDDPAAVIASGRVRVLLLANIHAGEVDGKEALLVLLRDLAAGRHRQWADSVVVLVAPLYNADGNERLHLERAGQWGPFGGMGERATAQGFDLNRDFVKLDSPEAWSLMGLLRRYDPHVVVDFHTTDGTYHAYHLTYAPPLHPHTFAPLTALLRGSLLPAVTASVRQRAGWEIYYYGNLPPPHAGNLAWVGMDTTAGWYTYDYRPRYSSNYVGLRNRLGLLSESYSYATFAERIQASLLFAEEVVNFTWGHAAEILRLTRMADQHSVVGEQLALAAMPVRSAQPVPILLGEVDTEVHPYSGGTVLRRRAVQRPVRLYEYGTFAATDSTPAPAAYLLPPDATRLVRLLTAHGIAIDTLRATQVSRLERFRIDSLRLAEVAYEGHRQMVVAGEWVAGTDTLRAGTLQVDVAQPLGRLACYLLEPRCDDSLLAWGLLGDDGVRAGFYGVRRRP
jgi:hypothetical protein